MSKSLDNYIGITDKPFEKFEKSMKILDNVFRQYFELATDLSSIQIDEIMDGDIREAHMSFAKELCVCMMILMNLKMLNKDICVLLKDIFKKLSWKEDI